MQHKLRFTPSADAELRRITADSSAKATLKQINKTLGYLETNLKSASLQTHEFKSLKKRYGQKVFEAYAQNDTPGAYRVFWFYGPDEMDSKGKRVPIITIVAITPHTPE
jgi:hypothetical protein